MSGWSKGEWSKMTCLMTYYLQGPKQLTTVSLVLESRGSCLIWRLYQGGAMRYLNAQEARYYLNNPDDLYMEELL